MGARDPNVQNSNRATQDENDKVAGTNKDKNQTDFKDYLDKQEIMTVQEGEKGAGVRSRGRYHQRQRLRPRRPLFAGLTGGKPSRPPCPPVGAFSTRLEGPGRPENAPCRRILSVS